MDIVIKNNVNKQKILNSWNRIITNLRQFDSTLADEIERFPLIISEDPDYKSIVTDTVLDQAYSTGGGGKFNFNYKGKTTHLIVLNIEKINEYYSAGDALDGMFSHELGHFFNYYPGSKTNEELLDYSKNKKLIDELYADSFSKKTSCQQSLKKCIEGALSAYLNNKETNEIRIQNLQNEEFKEGCTRKI